MGRGIAKRKKKEFLKSSEEFTQRNENTEDNGAPGGVCDMVLSLKDSKLTRHYSNVKPKLTSVHRKNTYTRCNNDDEHSLTSSSSNNHQSRSTVNTESSLNCTTDTSDSSSTVSNFITKSSLNGTASTNDNISLSKSKFGLCVTTKSVDSFTDESQFFRCLQNKQLRHRSVLENSLNFSNANLSLVGNSSGYDENRTQQSVDIRLSNETSSKLELTGHGKIESDISNLNDQTNSSQSCIDISSELSSSLTDGSQISQDALDKDPTSGLTIKCETGSNLSTTENSLVDSSATLHELPKFSRHISEDFMLFGGVNDSKSGISDEDISNNDNLSQVEILDGLSSLKAESTINQSNTEQTLLWLTNDRNQEHSNLSQSYNSSKFGTSLTNVSQMSLKELSESHEGHSNSLIVKSDSKSSFCSTDNSLNSLSDMSSGVQSSCEIVSNIQTLEATTTIYYKRMPQQIREWLTRRNSKSIVSDCFDGKRISSRKSYFVSGEVDSSSRVSDILLQDDISEGSTFSNVQHRSMEQDISNNQQKCSSNIVNSNSSELSYSKDLQNITHFDNETISTELNSMDSAELSNNSLSRNPRSSQVKVVKSDNVTNSTRSTSKRLNELRTSENVLPQFVFPRRKPKPPASNGGTDIATTSNAKIATVIENSNTSSSCDGMPQSFSLDCKENEILKSEEIANSINNENAETTVLAPLEVTEAVVRSTNGSQLRSLPRFRDSLRLRLIPLPVIQEGNVLNSKEALPLTSTNEIHSESMRVSRPTTSTTVAGDDGPRECLSDISNKINCMNVTKRKRNKIVKTHNLPAIIETSTIGLAENEIIEQNTLTTESGDQKFTDTHSLSLHSGKWRRLLSLHRRHSISMRSSE